MTRDESEVKFFLRKVVMFLIMPLVAYIPYLPIGILYGEMFLQRVKGPSDQQQVDNSFSGAASRDYDLLILGNSRVYRGINPDQLAIPSFNFGCDSDTFNQMYYKLKWVREQGRSPQFLVAGVDPFQFSFLPDVRNHFYSAHFDDAYLADYPPKPYAAERYKLRHFPKRLNPKYLFLPTDDRPFMRENGQYVRPGHPSPTDRVTRSARRLPIQIQYFEKLLADCRENRTKVFLCVMPTRAEELASYQPNEVEEFMTFLSGYLDSEITLLDFARDPSFILDDFSDITHLNEIAANRFSRQLSDAMLARISASRSSPEIAAEPRRPPVRSVSISDEKN